MEPGAAGRKVAAPLPLHIRVGLRVLLASGIARPARAGGPLNCTEVSNSVSGRSLLLKFFGNFVAFIMSNLNYFKFIALRASHVAPFVACGASKGASG
jgi:hypothetical protein